MSSVAKIYCKISFAWWFWWLFIPMLQSVCWVNDYLGIEYDADLLIRVAVKTTITGESI